MSQQELTKTRVRERSIALAPPPDYKIIYLNDDQTTFEFVIDSLQTTFDYAEDPAVDKAMEINESGSGVVAIMPFEIAEQKGVEVLMKARHQGFPLEVRLEQAE
jgi:ATP-dependent Clp protease adapter protein ClpS